VRAGAAGELARQRTPSCDNIRSAALGDLQQPSVTNGHDNKSSNWASAQSDCVAVRSPAVLTRMFYIAYEQEGRVLEVTPLMIAATTGNTPDVYRAGGAQHVPDD
jgi:hypothetical protein